MAVMIGMPPYVICEHLIPFTTETLGQVTFIGDNLTLVNAFDTV
jgi:hypothetical protein